LLCSSQTALGVKNHKEHRFHKVLLLESYSLTAVWKSPGSWIEGNPAIAGKIDHILEHGWTDDIRLQAILLSYPVDGCYKRRVSIEILDDLFGDASNLERENLAGGKNQPASLSVCFGVDVDINEARPARGQFSRQQAPTDAVLVVKDGQQLIAERVPETGGCRFEA
jgi:hypothetical protein